MNKNTIRNLGIDVIDTEAKAVMALKDRIDDSFVDACHLLFQCTGRAVVSGVGKSGHIGSKIAATLSSTGTPAFFVHPAEASHGDLGMIRPEDIFLGISKSGKSDELLSILPVLARKGVGLLSMTGDPSSPMARAANVHLDISVEKEACPLGLAPTASTSATLAMGDALAIALLGMRGFTADDFALTHPGGSLGRKLLLTVGDVMSRGSSIPTISPDQVVLDALVDISSKNLGLGIVTDRDMLLLGIFTDGDLRRAIDRDIDLKTATMSEVMTVGGQTISADALAVTAVELMQEHRISVMPVLDDSQSVCGVVHMHMLLKAGVV